MGALPKRKISRVRRDRKRAHYLRLKKPAFIYCKSCGEPHLSHHVCLHCGKYNGRQVLQIKEDE
jgi:large subunit ribosomal protein L32